MVFSCYGYPPRRKARSSRHARRAVSLRARRNRSVADKKLGERSLDVLRWGLVPYWAKDLKVGFANINAKAERIESKPAFRESFQCRRCLVAVESFYECKKTTTGKQPYAIALADHRRNLLSGRTDEL